MNKAKYRNVRIFLAYLFMMLGIISVILQWHLLFTLIFVAGLWILNYQNYLKYSYNLEYFNHFFGHVLIGWMMDYVSEYPLFTLSMVTMFPANGGIRNRFPFLIGTNKFLWIEKSFWFISLSIFLISLYLNTWKWNYLEYFIPSFIFATVYSWYVRTVEANAYIKNQELKNQKLKKGIEPGDKAIQFELPDQNGNLVKLTDFYGKMDVLLLFVRGDWCPACHIMLRTYYKYRDKFKEKGVYFIAIGPDPQGVNKEMLERIGTDFVILSDENLKITNQYGVQGEGQIPNNDFEGIPLPAAFIIDKNGIVRYTTRPESPGSFLRPDSILTVLDGLKADVSNETFEETYETIVNQSNDGILVLDIVEGKILKSNIFFSHLLGYSTENFLRKTIFDFTPKEFLNESAKLIADAWENKGAIFRMQFLDCHQEVIPTECSAKVIPYGKYSALVLYIRDIRERLKLENQIIKQSQIIEQKNKDILDSIEYAKRIQSATLPRLEDWHTFTKQTYVYFQPKDIVSGDFYWLNFDKDEQRVFFALGDCTGHGVPGAFMSMLAINQLNHIIDDLKIKEPLKIIENLDYNIQKALKQEEGGNDGLDCALFMYDISERKLQFVLAGRPLYYSLDNQNIIELKGDKFPIGGTIHKSKSFYQHQIFIPENQSFKLLMYSDGIVDQMGGEKKKKFGTKNLKQLLDNQGFNDLRQTYKKLSQTIEDWKKDHEQLDDMTLIFMEI